MNVWKLVTVVGLLLAALAPAACGRAPSAAAGTISEDRFIEAYVALSRIDRDTAAADSLRAEVLAEHEVTEEQLREFVTARSRDPQQLAAVWDEIRTRIQQLQDAPVDEGMSPIDAEAPPEEPDDAGFEPAPGIPRELPDRIAPRTDVSVIQ